LGVGDVGGEFYEAESFTAETVNGLDGYRVEGVGRRVELMAWSGFL